VFCCVVFWVPVFLLGCKDQQNIVQIGDQTYDVEIADDSDKRRRGLMFREHLDVGTGMLFEYEKEGDYRFWMKNTLIPLDIIWISADKKVIDKQTVLPCKKDPCPTYIPSGVAQYILEVNADTFEGEVGDLVRF